MSRGDFGGAVLLVSESLRVTWASHRSRTLFDLAEDVTAPPIRKLLPDLNISEGARWLEQSFRQGGYKTSTRAVTALGKVLVVEILIQGLELAGQTNFIFEVFLAAERQSDVEQGLYALALSATNDGVCVSDLRQHGNPVVFANDAFERVTGLPLSGVLGRDILSTALGFDDQQRRSLRLALGNGDSWDAVVSRGTENVRATRISLSPIRTGDSVTHLLCICSDVTGEQDEERRRRLRYAHSNFVLDMNPDGIVLLDDSSHVVLSNAAFERMTGLSTNVLRGKSRFWLEQMLQELADGHSPQPQYTHTSYADTQPAELSSIGVVQHNNTAPEVLHLRNPRERTLLRRIHQSADDPRLAVMFFRDITREKALNIRRTEFLSMAAHELRAPVSTILGFSELLVTHDFDAEGKRDVLQTIHRQSVVMTTLINDLLDMCRLDDIHADAESQDLLELQWLIRETLTRFAVPAGRLEVEVQMQTNPLMVNADAYQIRLMVSNVLSNAYKYSPSTSPIRLSLRMQADGDVAKVGIEITDSGIGMSEDQVARIFEKFYRADNCGDVPGTGLGMTLVKEAAEFLGGYVTVRSQLGEGTAVTVWLPLAD